jgi:hypothetical protein
MEVRRTIACLIVLAAIFFAGFVSGAPNEDAGCKDSHATEEAPISPSQQTKDTPANSTKSANCYTPKWYTAFKRPDGMLVVVGILTFLVIAWQSVATARSAKAAQDGIELMINKERARLTIDIQDLDLTPQGGPYFVNVKVSILGITPAFIVDSKCAAYIVPKQFLTDPETMDRAMLPLYTLPSVIPPNSPPIECYTLLSFDDGEGMIEEVRLQRLFVGIRGNIIYKDVFDRTRRTSFRYACDYHQIPGLGAGWVQCGAPEENEAT